MDYDGEPTEVQKCGFGALKRRSYEGIADSEDRACGRNEKGLKL